MEGKWEVFVKELKMVSFLSAPMVAVSVLQYSLPFVTLMMVVKKSFDSKINEAIQSSLKL